MKRHGRYTLASSCHWPRNLATENRGKTCGDKAAWRLPHHIVTALEPRRGGRQSPLDEDRRGSCHCRAVTRIAASLFLILAIAVGGRAMAGGVDHAPELVIIPAGSFNRRLGRGRTRGRLSARRGGIRAQRHPTTALVRQRTTARRCRDRRLRHHEDADHQCPIRRVRRRNGPSRARCRCRDLEGLPPGPPL